MLAEKKLQTGAFFGDSIRPEDPGWLDVCDYDVVRYICGRQIPRGSWKLEVMPLERVITP